MIKLILTKKKDKDDDLEGRYYVELDRIVQTQDEFDFATKRACTRIEVAPEYESWGNEFILVDGHVSSAIEEMTDDDYKVIEEEMIYEGQNGR